MTGVRTTQITQGDSTLRILIMFTKTLFSKLAHSHRFWGLEHGHFRKGALFCPLCSLILNIQGFYYRNSHMLCLEKLSQVTLGLLHDTYTYTYTHTLLSF